MRVIIHMGGIGQGAKHLLGPFQQAAFGIGGSDESNAQGACAKQQGD
jgi:hypothetical protein